MSAELAAERDRARARRAARAGVRRVGPGADRRGLDRPGAPRASRTTGVAVAVKVQYPGVDEAIEADLDNAGLLFAGMSACCSRASTPARWSTSSATACVEELDYRLEADNQRLFADYYARPPVHPRPARRRRAVDRPGAHHRAGRRRALRRARRRGRRRSATSPAEAIYRFVFRSLYRLHAFNGDPHPGNYLFRPGGHVTFLDFGLVKRFTPAEMDMFEKMAETLVVRPRTAPVPRACLEEAGVLKPGSGMSDEEIVDYFGYYYDPVMEDREYTFTLQYASEAMKKIMPVGPGTSPEIRKFGNLPPAFGVLQRINLGMTAVMAHLGATGNWRRTAEELWVFTSGPPSTEMGEKEAAWLAGRVAKRALLIGGAVAAGVAVGRLGARRRVRSGTRRWRVSSRLGVSVAATRCSAGVRIGRAEGSSCRRSSS